MTQPGNGGQRTADATTVAGLAALLAAPTVQVGRVVPLLGRLGVPRQVATAATHLVLSQEPVPTLPIGPATKQAIRENLLRRAQYLISASQRIARAVGASRDPAALLSALNAERQYFRQHIAAASNREQSGAEVDKTANQHGPIVGWLAVRDARTSPECSAASGKNFLANQRPRIGWPGAVHPDCRCKPVRAWPTRQLVDGGLLPTAPHVIAAALQRRDAIDLTRR